MRAGVAVGVSEDEITAPAAAGGGTTLTVQIGDAEDPVINVVNFDYFVNVTNTGAIDATSVEVTVTLDASLTFVSGSGTGWTVGHSAGVVTCTRATLAVGLGPLITITVTTADAASIETSTVDAIAANAPAATQDSQLTTVKLVARDATSGIRVPASLTQWQDFNAYHVSIGTANYPNVVPTCLWLCQEASGNLTDVIGGVTLTQSGAGHLYQQAVAGWSRLAIQNVDGTVGQKWINSTTAPNPNTVSTNWLGYIGFPVANPAAARDLFANAAALDFRLSTAGRMTILNGASTTGASTYTNTGVHICEVKHDITNSTFMGYSDLEKITGTFATNVSNPMFVIGGQTISSSGSAFLYVAIFSGAAAELTDAQHKARQIALGWSPPWS